MHSFYSVDIDFEQLEHYKKSDDLIRQKNEKAQIADVQSLLKTDNHNYYMKDKNKIQNFNWDSKMEKKFQKSRKELSRVFGVTNFNEKQISNASLEPFIRSMCKKKNESDFRNEIMTKYMNREFMT